MPIAMLFLSIFLGVSTFYITRCAIKEEWLFWIPAIYAGFWTIVAFAKFLAMC